MDSALILTRSANHPTIRVERHLNHPPALVYFAYSDPTAKAAWFRGPPDWDIQPHQQET